MADKKKPVKDARDKPEPEQGTTPETAAPETGPTETESSESAPETVSTGSDDVLGEEVKDAGASAGLDPYAEDTPPAAAAEASGPEGADTPPADSVAGLEGEDTLAGTELGKDTLSGDDSLSSGETPDTVTPEPANSMESIHSVGEAVELDAEAGKESETHPDADTLIASVEDTIATETDRIEPATATVLPRQVVHEKVIERKGGFVPMALGGVLAAALGWAASSYQSGSFPFGDGGAGFEAQTSAALAQQSEKIDAMGSTLEQTAAQVGGIDLSGLETSTADLGQRMQAAEGSAASLTEQVAALQARIESMQNQWLSESVSPEAMAAYEKALDDVRRAIETQRAEVEQMTQEAMAAKQSASDQAMLAKSRTALSEINTALRDGAPYGDALQVLQTNGVEVPAGLAATAGDGAPTHAALVAEFPPAARDALSAARRAEATTEDTASRFTTFFANQLGARSVEPREGDDPDAVLSRAEAALRSGDLNATLDEISALPEPAKAELTAWTARAEARKAALDGADAVAQTLNQN